MPTRLPAAALLAAACLAAHAQPTDQGVSLAGCARVGAVAGAAERSLVTFRAWHADRLPLVGTGLLLGAGDRVLVTAGQVSDADRIEVDDDAGGSRSAFVLGEDVPAGLGVLVLDRPLQPAAPPVAVSPPTGSVGFAITVTQPTEDEPSADRYATPFIVQTAGSYGGFVTALQAQCGSLSGPAFNGSKQFIGWHLYDRLRTRLVGPDMTLAVARQVTDRGLDWKRRTGFSAIDGSKRLSEAYGLSTRGVMVTSVDPASPAAAAGLRERDLIVAADGRLLADFATLATLLPAGVDSTTLSVMGDDGQTHPVRVGLRR